MSSNVKTAVLKAGIVPPSVQSELNRWNFSTSDEPVPVVSDPREVVEEIRESIESKDTATFRTTDLDALRIYEKEQKVGRLYYALNADDGRRGVPVKTTFTEVTYAVLPSGQYIIPWTDDEEGTDIHFLMVSEYTYLKPVGGERVSFSDVDNLFYGENKTFIICTPKK